MFDLLTCVGFVIHERFGAPVASHAWGGTVAKQKKKEDVSWSFLGAIVESEAHLGRFGDAKLSIFDAP